MTQLLIQSGDIDTYDINRVDKVVDGDCGQGTFRFPMNILYIMNNVKRHESIQPMGYIVCKKKNSIMLKMQ